MKTKKMEDSSIQILHRVRELEEQNRNADKLVKKKKDFFFFLFFFEYFLLWGR